MPARGALAPAEAEEIEGVAYEFIDDKQDANGTADGEIKGRHATISDDSNHQLLSHMPILME